MVHQGTETQGGGEERPSSSLDLPDWLGRKLRRDDEVLVGA